MTNSEEECEYDAKLNSNVAPNDNTTRHRIPKLNRNLIPPMSMGILNSWRNSLKKMLNSSIFSE